jgi:NAD(P)-dependent dehydrogenase (short-subunit alcohol dehydrogenase family)
MSYAISLAGKRALVTGASGGLGAHFARLLARAGARVALGARRLAKCEEIAAEIRASGGEAIALRLDVAEAAGVDAAITIAASALDGLDILINNAGIATTTPLLEIEEAEWDRILDVNLKGAFSAARAAARVMIAQGRGGTIVNIASILGIGITKQVAPYATAKAGLIQLTRAMALEWARHSIRVNALCPGYVETDINRDFFATEAGRTVIGRIPQRRLLQPGDLDLPLLLLASDAGAGITGVALPVDGGHLLASL